MKHVLEIGEGGKKNANLIAKHIKVKPNDEIAQMVTRTTEDGSAAEGVASSPAFFLPSFKDCHSEGFVFVDERFSVPGNQDIEAIFMSYLRFLPHNRRALVI